MEDMNLDKVTISIDDYSEMYEAEIKLSYFLRALMDNSKLSYNKKYLNYDDETISTILKMLEPYAYEARLKDLRKEESDGTDNTL